MTEADILSQLNAARDSAMGMISILVSIIFGYLAAFYLVLGDRGIFQRVFVYFIALFSFVFFILNFGIPLRKEITALTEDLRILDAQEYQLSNAAMVVVDPCSDMYFDFFQEYVTRAGTCQVDETVYFISDLATVALWLVMFMLTILNPWRRG